DQTRAGITWNSETDYSFNIDGNARVQNGTYDLPVSAQISAPQQIMLSLVHDINPQWSVMGDLGWQAWSQFGAPQFVVGAQ
uniref:outer membrane protein transport protein n=1 Tax=Serratia marcescens TaxID=615 RepID=UPI0019531E71